MPVIKNKIFIYLFSRYLTYALQFIISLVVAARLGPYYLGLYGFVQLILSYFDQVNFGIPHSLNVFLVQNKKNMCRQNELTMNSLALCTYLSVLVVILCVIYTHCCKFQFGEYHIAKYILPICLMAILTYYNSVFVTVIRFRNQVELLSLVGSLPIIANLCVVFLFEEEALVRALVYSNLISCIVVTSLFYYKGAFPKFNIFEFKIVTQKWIIHKGLYLFLYNTCFYFILITVRTIISVNYTIEEFGYFTFSFTIANAVMLLLTSLNTIIFPKTIDILFNGTNESRIIALGKLRVGYVTTSHMLIYLALIAFPTLLVFFPQYQSALQSMNMIALAVLMNANSYGYNTLLIAQNKEKISSMISLVALIVNIVTGLLLVYMLKVSYSFVILSVMISYMFFSYLAAYFGEKLLYGFYSHRRTIRSFFPFKFLIPYMVALIITMFNLKNLIWLAFVIFFILNFKDLSFLKNLIVKMKNNPNIIDV